jgi:hypothetical protein
VRLPRELLEGLGRDAETVSFDSAFYFHGTRVTDPDSFYRNGILPLDDVIERLWAALFELVRDERSTEEWAAFRGDVERDAEGHDGLLYRLKTGDRLHFGPYGLLVRETLRDPSATSSHDYLGCRRSSRTSAAATRASTTSTSRPLLRRLASGHRKVPKAATCGQARYRRRSGSCSRSCATTN